MPEFEESVFVIPKSKAEVPAIIVLALLVFVGWALCSGFMGFLGGIIWLIISIPTAVIVIKKRSGEYFVRINNEGISWRLHFFSKYIFIPWNYLQRIDFLVYEINFMIKETAQVECLATSGLNDEQVDLLKTKISQAVDTFIDK